MRRKDQSDESCTCRHEGELGDNVRVDSGKGHARDKLMYRIDGHRSLRAQRCPHTCERGGVEYGAIRVLLLAQLLQYPDTTRVCKANISNSRRQGCPSRSVWKEART